jgi:hypothetical protein
MACPAEPVALLLRELGAGRAALMLAISGVGEQQFKRLPPASPSDPDPWCVAEVLAHILTDETLWTARMRAALAVDGAGVTPTDRAQSLTSVRNGRQAPVPQLIHGLLAARRDLERVLGAAAAVEGALARTVSHPQRGNLSIAWIARKLIIHEQEHVAQIESIRDLVQAAAGSQRTTTP